MALSNNFIYETAKIFSSARDREFFLRVYQVPEDIYIRRLCNINFTGRFYVLDAGCGFGQWSMALARLNKQVYSIELDINRLRGAINVAKKKNIENIEFVLGDIEDINVPAETFDAIFCYSTIYYTDFRKTLKEFHRVLKPDGKLYFSTNGLGWYIYNIIERPYQSRDFDPRRMAIEAIKNSLEFYNNGNAILGGSIIMPRDIVVQILSLIGFSDIIADGEARIVVIPRGEPCVSFFKES
ncbi:MAG: class I SAM-dependent methyltransferase [Candidatus Omnitrophica bacterium]|nr:class I SAM-dependent methyltransferase [Candidatus Omnitrophota bacterium]